MTTSPARWCSASNKATGSIHAPFMGRRMARAGGELLADADALLPVPLHWRRLWARRFN
jgi:predicted amidophosphoribosyltransferase